MSHAVLFAFEGLSRFERRDQLDARRFLCRFAYGGALRAVYWLSFGAFKAVGCEDDARVAVA